MRANAIVYDCEIKKAIRMPNEPELKDIEYCDGWRDFAGMGVSCIGVKDFKTGSVRLFMDDNIDELRRLIEEREVVVSFNGDAFDAPLLKATYDIDVPRSKSYDILAEMWEGAGLSRTFDSKKNAGFGLDKTCRVNLDIRKTGNGALAPVNYQRREFGKLIDYCLNDIHMTTDLVKLIVMREGVIKDPRDPTQWLSVRVPPGAWV